MMAKTYLESIGHFSEAVQADLIEWSTRTRFPQAPAELSFLRPGFVDLGIENLGLGEDEHKALLLAFCGDGVAVPGTPYKLRFTGMAMSTVVEPATGTEPPLPVHWKQGLYVVDAQGRLTWIGKRVRPDQVGKVDLPLYQDVGDGWQLRSDP
jgi:hypothetical protein